MATTTADKGKGDKDNVGKGYNGNNGDKPLS